MPNMSTHLLAVGTAVPENILTNADLEKILDTSDEWIITRTGIRERRICDADDNIQASDLGAEAALKALQRADVKPSAVDAIICATSTPDNFFPSTACILQAKLECVNAYSFDISAACSGFVYALGLADAMIRSRQCATVLVVGSEIISRTLDWTDRKTCVLFGDGAGAVVLRGVESNGRGILACAFAGDGRYGDILVAPSQGRNRFLRMNGGEVFKHAVRSISTIVRRVCELAGVELDQVDLIIPHQANIRILKGIAEHLGIPMENIFANIERYGNTSSASIPLALDEAWRRGEITAGRIVVLAAFGGGLTVGGVVVRF